MIISKEMPSSFNSLKIGLLGCGHIAQNLITALLKYSHQKPENIFISGRNIKKTQRISKKLGIQMVLDNENLLEHASIIFLCIKPEEAKKALQNLKAHCHSHHTIISLMAGISFHQLKKWGIDTRRLVRLMPNTAVSVGKGFLPFCSLNNQENLNAFVSQLLEPLGHVVILKEESLLIPATVASSSGLAFILEIMEYWLEWLQEEGFSNEQARNLVTQTFLGASKLSQQKKEKSFSDLQKEISSSKGVTHLGLTSMRELELERILRISFEKARSRIKEIAYLASL